MRYTYWWISALLGVVLIVAPFVGKFTALHAASYTDLIVGILLLVWALVGYTSPGEKTPGMQSGRA